MLPPCSELSRSGNGLVKIATPVDLLNMRQFPHQNIRAFVIELIITVEIELF
jgi:hypothetical protein